MSFCWSCDQRVKSHVTCTGQGEIDKIDIFWWFSMLLIFPVKRVLLLHSSFYVISKPRYYASKKKEEFLTDMFCSIFP